EFVANAVTHGGGGGELSRRQVAENLGLRLVRRTGEVICAVLDPSDSAPVLRAPGSIEESGRGLQMVDALSDVWGWSPVAGRGKAVWAILFCALPLPDSAPAQNFAFPGRHLGPSRHYARPLGLPWPLSCPLSYPQSAHTTREAT